MDFEPINSKELTLILLERGLFDNTISIADALKPMGLTPKNLLITDNETLERFIEIYKNLKMEKEYEEKEEVSYISDFDKKKENVDNSEKKIETVIEIPNIDDIIRKEQKPEIVDLDDEYFKPQNNNFQNNQHVVIDVEEEKNQEGSYEDLMLDMGRNNVKSNEKIEVKNDFLREIPKINERNAEFEKSDEASPELFEKIEGKESKNEFSREIPKINERNGEFEKSDEGSPELFSEKASFLQKEEEKSIHEEEYMPNLVKNSERLPSEQKILLQTEEENKLDHVSFDKEEEEEEEALCLQHQWQYVNYCPNHAILLCPLCLDDQKADHANCPLTNANTINRDAIIIDTFIDIKTIQSDSEKVIEKLSEVLRGLEKKQQQLSFELIKESVEDDDVSLTLGNSEDNKQFILEVAQIVFEKYLISIIKIFNDRTMILEQVKNMNEYAEEDKAKWERCIEKQEKNIAFNKILARKRELIKINKEINAHKRLTDPVMAHPKKKMTEAIFKTIFGHLSQLYIKLPSN